MGKQLRIDSQAKVWLAAGCAVPYQRTLLFFFAQPLSVLYSASEQGYQKFIWLQFSGYLPLLTSVELLVISYNFCDSISYLALQGMIPVSPSFSPYICKWHSHRYVCNVGLFTVTAEYIPPCSWSVLQLEFSGAARERGRFLFSPLDVLGLPPSGCLWAGPSSRQPLLLALRSNEFKQWNHSVTI